MGRLVGLVFWGAAFVLACFLALLPLKSYAYGPVGTSPKDCFTHASAPLEALYPGCKTRDAGMAGQHRGYSFPPPAGYSDGAITMGACGMGPTNWNCPYSFPRTHTATGTNTTQNVTMPVNRASSLVCPENSTPGAGGTCTCAVGFYPSPDGLSCLPDDCQKKADDMADDRIVFTGKGRSTCVAGCLMNCGATGYKASTNTSWCEEPRWSGKACAGDGPGGNDPGTGEDPQPPCPAGQCRGTVGTTSVCVACDSTGAAGPSTGASGPGKGNGTGEETTETSTDCKGSDCTTTTTTTDGNGDVISEETKGESKESFCEQNPASPICEELKGSFGGTCGAFTCDGDAVQCAMAKEQHRRACEFFEVDTLLKQAGEDAANGQATPDGHPRASGSSSFFNLAGLIDQSPRLSSSCPPDVSFVLMGQAVVLEMSKVCAPLGMVGQAGVAVSLLAAMFIVFRRS